jgi:protein-S-isoprenylcysteine O-methyltransferase Ste14
MTPYMLYVSTGISAALGLYVLSKTKRDYEKKEKLSAGTSLGWWMVDTAWIALVVTSSLYNLWPLPIEEIAALTVGLALFTIGGILTLAGIAEFRSLRRVSGVEISKLITTGIYRWSRNPQFLGFYLALLGVSFIGRSGYALLLTIIVIACCHYYIIKIEEPYLECIFGKEYLKYKSRTPRYFGIPKVRTKP